MAMRGLRAAFVVLAVRPSEGTRVNAGGSGTDMEMGGKCCCTESNWNGECEAEDGVETFLDSKSGACCKNGYEACPEPYDNEDKEFICVDQFRVESSDGDDPLPDILIECMTSADPSMIFACLRKNCVDVPVKAAAYCSRSCDEDLSKAETGGEEGRKVADFCPKKCKLCGAVEAVEESSNDLGHSPTKSPYEKVEEQSGPKCCCSANDWPNKCEAEDGLETFLDAKTGACCKRGSETCNAPYDNKGKDFLCVDQFRVSVDTQMNEQEVSNQIESSKWIECMSLLAEGSVRTLEDLEPLFTCLKDACVDVPTEAGPWCDGECQDLVPFEGIADVTASGFCPKKCNLC